MNLRIREIFLVSLLAISLLPLGGCRLSEAKEVCMQCGVIQSITPRVIPGEPSAGGTLAGAIIGGVVGHQIGDGSGQKAATAAGVLGGAFAGREIERRQKSRTVYDVLVRMESGETRVVMLAKRTGFFEGDTIEIRNGQLVPGFPEHS